MILLEVRPFFIHISFAHAQSTAPQLYYPNDLGGQILKVCNHPDVLISPALRSYLII